MGCVSSKSSKMVQSAASSPSRAAENASDAFEMLIVGSGGGPDQTNLSHYLVKPKDASWRDGILSLEGGSLYRAYRRPRDVALIISQHALYLQVPVSACLDRFLNGIQN